MKHKTNVMYACMALGLVTAVLFFGQVNVDATSKYGWIGAGEPILIPQETVSGDGIQGAQLKEKYSCTFSSVTTVSGDATHSGQSCIIHGTSMNITTAWGSDIYMGFAGGGGKLYKLDNIRNGLDSYIGLQNTDTLIKYRSYSNFLVNYPGYLSVTKGYQKNLSPQRNAIGKLTGFNYNDNPDFVFQNERGPWNVASGMAFSDNGKWAVAEIVDVGFVRINLETFEARRFSTVATRDTWPASYLRMAFAISDDGVYVASSGLNVPLTFHKIDDDCGDILGFQHIASSQPIQNSCESRSMDGNYLRDVVGLARPDINPIDIMKFSEGAGLLKIAKAFGANHNETESTVTYAVLRAPNYSAHSRLDYLALGDSYSSGEGDTERISTTNLKWYRDYTDNNEDYSKGIPKEKCHISLRSYPYKLARFMNLPGKNWDTVACSGATTNDVNPLGTQASNYLGQSKADKVDTPRLTGYSNKEQLKATALNEFIPGRNAQIEFVKKYKPKVITLTMGGNDVGFGDKIDACARWPLTCEFAQTGYRQKLKNELRDMYVDLMVLYRKLNDASEGQSKIYVLGYPQFINDGSEASCENTLNLNTDERKMIFHSVEYYNNVIEQAAKRIGVKYVDIEESLGNHKLCDSAEKYVTGITGIFGYKGNETQESFHPNAKGHEAIANTVKAKLGGQSLLDHSWCPDAAQRICPDGAATQDTIPTPVNGYFEQGAATNSMLKKKQITTKRAEKNAPISLKLDRYSGSPGSTFTSTLYSDPTDLGDLTVDADGAIDAFVTIPTSVPAGYHTLIIAGQTYSGEPIEYYQSILVTGSDPNDLDENGVLDNQQVCGPFMITAGVDADMDGIDDACDLEVSESPRLYRVRMGNPDRIYAGQPEKIHYFYIERNTRANSITGVSGDNDPDADGWAIVGASQGRQYTATSVPDTGPVANFRVVGAGVDSQPYVYIRAGGWGCVQYKPTSLGKITASQSRTVTRVAVNTDECRMEASAEDADNDGKADNSQDLYVARQGREVQGEDPGRIYLYRSFHAAESQLGVSDYSPTGTAANTIAAISLIPTIGDLPNHPVLGRSTEPIQQWNIIATSKQGEYIPAFNKLAILEDTNGNSMPIVLTKKQNGQCIAYKPSNTNIIKFNQQNTLVKLANVPGGVSCE